MCEWNNTIMKIKVVVTFGELHFIFLEFFRDKSYTQQILWRLWALLNAADLAQSYQTWKQWTCFFSIFSPII